MDSLITAAARALAQGDSLGALKRVALRDDAPALALRGIAMAQLGEFARARALLRSAARAFGNEEPLSRARCIVAEAEVALAARDLAWPTKQLDNARTALESHGDKINAAHAHLLEIRRLVLIGRLNAAEQLMDGIDIQNLPPALQAGHDLMRFGIAVRRLRTREAESALQRAQHAARLSGIPSLLAETQAAAILLTAPSAQLIAQGTKRLLRLSEVEALLSSNSLVVDGCRFVVRYAGAVVSLARRPILFALARELAEAWPNDVSRQLLIARVFRIRRPEESHRARLRVEIGRLRTAIRSMASLDATEDGFALKLRGAKEVALIVPPIDDDHAEVLALVADGESWSSSAVALALGASQRSVQRALEALASQGKVQALGQGRSRRWITAPLPGFATTLLLPAPLPNV